MIGAWDYAQSAIGRGLTATEGLREYRAGGGAIRNESWYDLTRLAVETRDIGDRVAGQQIEPPIPGSAYSVVGDDYGHKYVVVADVSYIDAATEKPVTRIITVESDEVRSWGDIEAEIGEVVSGYGVMELAGGVSITHAELFSPQWIEW